MFLPRNLFRTRLHLPATDCCLGEPAFNGVFFRVCPTDFGIEEADFSISLAHDAEFIHPAAPGDSSPRVSFPLDDVGMFTGLDELEGGHGGSFLTDLQSDAI